MKRLVAIVICCTLSLAFSTVASADWINKSGFEDYAQHQVGQPPQPMRLDGMPDFDQRQDAWQNAFGQWVWCGPVAVSNCLWWFDSKMESIKGKSLPPGAIVRPPAISDHYSLVYAMMAGFDDHDPMNVIPYVTLLGNQVPGGVGMLGITPQQMKSMIENYIALPQVNLYGHYNVRIISSPSFDEIFREIVLSQDVIILLGFWQQDNTGMWHRFGGHYLTVAGVDTQNAQPKISLCDPMADAAERGLAGVTWTGWLIPHLFPPAHPSMIHNDAGNVSHDHYVVAGSGSPGGIASPVNYGFDYGYEFWENFQNQNVPDNLQQYQGNYNPGLPVHTELEAMVVVCPNFDYGDLSVDYPTIDIESCGPAHPLSDKAWLGDCVNAEVQPNIYDQDGCDDGVNFVNLPWTPGDMEQVDVTVTTGAHYAGEPLYLNAWKDGNIDGDFDDITFNDMIMNDEWIIQDQPVMPGLNTFTFIDPGPVMLGRWDPYDLIIRFRLTSQTVGRYGYGGYWIGGVSNGLGTFDIDWILGEVEDYDSTDMQLAVELQSFDAAAGNGSVTLKWTTASESDIDYYSLNRSISDGEWTEIARVTSHGNSAGPQYYAYRDAPLANGQTYSYYLSARNLNGEFEYLAEAEATPDAAPLPQEFALSQNYPNPFNAGTVIRYALPEASNLTLTVYNVTGGFVATLVNSHVSAGEHIVTFDASALPTGVYLYTLRTENFSATRKMVLIR